MKSLSLATFSYTENVAFLFFFLHFRNVESYPVKTHIAYSGHLYYAFLSLIKFFLVCRRPLPSISFSSRGCISYSFIKCELTFRGYLNTKAVGKH